MSNTPSPPSHESLQLFWMELPASRTPIESRPENVTVTMTLGAKWRLTGGPAGNTLGGYYPKTDLPHPRAMRVGPFFFVSFQYQWTTGPLFMWPILPI
jgi:hypothetical protein